MRLASIFVLAAVGCDKPAAPPSATAPAATAPATAPPAPPAPAAKPEMPTDAVPGFAGFSQDGMQFAWVVPSPKVPELIKLSIISTGDDDPKTQLVDTPEGRERGKARLLSDGFTAVRRPVPSDLTFEANLTASPPTFTLVRGSKRGMRHIGKYPFEPTDVAELWGLSADGEHVAIHIHGKDVPGLLSKGGGGTFHFFFVAQVP